MSALDPIDTPRTVIYLEGDLGLADRPAVEEKLPAPSREGRIVLDCSLVNSIDSSIIAAIMLFRQRRIIAGMDPHDIVALVPPRLYRIFELTGLTRAITVVEV